MAVHTKTSFVELEKHLQDNYQLGKLISVKEIIEGIDNSNFIIETNIGKFIFTIFENRIKSEDLPYFISLKTHLANKNICCPKPINSSVNGESITEIKGKKSVIVTFLSGSMLRPQENGYYSNISQKHCFEVAKTLAQLHLAVTDFKQDRVNDLGALRFGQFFSKFANQINSYQVGLREEIVEIINYLEKNWQDYLPKGATHLDLFPDNVFFNEKQEVSGVIDFYFAANDSFIYDFAVIINAWCFDKNDVFDEEKFNAAIKGYQSQRNFTVEELNFLPTALVAAALRFLLTRLHDMFNTPKESLVKIKNPQEYLAKLQFFKKIIQEPKKILTKN